MSLRAWLRAPGSLSARLARHGRFEVQLLRQAPAPLGAPERQQLGPPRHGCTLVREVVLRVGGQPLVWARSSLHRSTLAGPWKALKGLGRRPLAELLYQDRRVQRSTLQPKRLLRHGPTRRHMQRQWVQATGSPPPAGMVWARHSVFKRQGALLRILELFHPDVSALAPYPGTRRPTLKTLASTPAGRLHHPQWRRPTRRG
ncbi:chorismate--pyruvate lyase family protein [Inhella gelatinilytica]|uniref:Probable chorismate pyruvate-lyase n=1 Tax=Inhella gelatinilytica TaxID=2795030 RepID=A0A931NCL1_9BURK|nr:chorismate lyase [Inhella gelatinilytica]MBH9552137.1 chorismate lyase [Inhella gelatinilytica]